MKTDRSEYANKPMVTGLILMPSSVWADAGSSQILCERTSDSHSVFTNVVRPVPEVPEIHPKNIYKRFTSKWREQRQKALVSPAAKEKIRTNHHNGELDTLFGLVSSASAGERHRDWRKYVDIGTVCGGWRRRESWCWYVLFDAWNSASPSLSHNSGAKQSTH